MANVIVETKTGRTVPAAVAESTMWALKQLVDSGDILVCYEFWNLSSRNGSNAHDDTVCPLSEGAIQKLKNLALVEWDGYVNDDVREVALNAVRVNNPVDICNINVTLVSPYRS
jgi:hypothetical protein